MNYKFLIACLATLVGSMLFSEDSKVNHEFSETHHQIKINEKEIAYTATAGSLLIKNDKGEPKATMFFVSYTKEGEDNKANRPIAYCFNGGPGSSSVWLHMGALGPKRVNLTENGEPILPYQYKDNELSLLDVADLVFIDPISTGYSKAINGEDAKQFHGVEEDIKSVGEFIRLFTTHFNRWESPKFLVGESYGTTRAAGLAQHLHDRYKMDVNGLILISSVLYFRTLDFSENNDLPYVLFLPTYASAAWYHKKLSPELQAKSLGEVIEEAKQFAMNDYLLALVKGELVDELQKEEVIKKLAYFTGLDSKYIEKSNMRVDSFHFMKELLRQENRIVGRFDSRFLGIGVDPLEESMEYDPSMERMFGVFASTFHEYVCKDLKWKKDEYYDLLANVWPWNYGKAATNQYLNVTTNLKEAMTKSGNMRVFVANGLYDLATPHFATEYTFNHMGLDSAIRDHIEMGYYEAGHIMFIHYPSLMKLSKDLHRFIESTLKAQQNKSS